MGQLPRRRQLLLYRFGLRVLSDRDRPHPLRSDDAYLASEIDESVRDNRCAMDDLPDSLIVDLECSSFVLY